MPEVAGGFPRAWVEFTDPADPEQVIRADLTWLTSRYACIFGHGCPGIEQEAPDAGCCVHGAHFSDTDDEDRVATWVGKLGPDLWQRWTPVDDRDSWIETDGEGDRKTRTIDGACVLLNRAGFSGGAGCALHLLAVREQTSPIETKPDVCWQLPIRRGFHWDERPDGSQQLVVTITEYERSSWGGGGAEFAWYCSSNTESHRAAEPLYLTCADELVALIGRQAYKVLRGYCADHEAARRLLPLRKGARGLAPHPADGP